jgi:hypothetical protein
MAASSHVAPSSAGGLATDDRLQPVTAAVRSVLAVLSPGALVTQETTPPRPLG